MMKPKLIADDKILLVHALFGEDFEVVSIPGRSITRDDLIDAQALLIRTVTQVDSSLLEGTNIKIVASATSGFDHVDLDYLSQHQIEFVYSPGCNANAVSEYVLSCMAVLRENDLLKPTFSVGVIGVGEVGARVTKNCEAIGVKVFQNDPPVGMNDDITNCDIICIHAPLVRKGDHPTYHLIDQKFLSKLKPGTVILNASRGSVIDTDALLKTENLIYCMDVWENEPNVNLELMNRCFIATPHIAGYSLPAKQRATIMVYDQMCHFFGIKKPKHAPTTMKQLAHLTEANWQLFALNHYNPLDDTQKMKSALNKPNGDIIHEFLMLRREYELRDEYHLDLGKL